MSGVATAPGTEPRPRGDGDLRHGRAGRWLWGILAVGFALRLAWVIYASRQPQGLSDPVTYLATARGIAAGNGYLFLDGSPTAYFPIGYPALLAGVVWVVDHTPLANVPKTMGVLQAVLGTMSIWFSWRIASRIAGPRTGLLAAGIVALFPGLLLYSAPLLSETLFVFLELAAITVIVDRPWAEGVPSARRLVAFGVLTALAALVRPPALLLVVALALALLIARFGWRRALKAGGIALVAMLLTIAPWTVRNAITMDAFLPISSNTGDDLCIGHNPAATGAFAFYPACDDVKGAGGRGREVARDRKNTREALNYAWSNPRREAELLFLKARYTYNGDYEAVDAVEGFGKGRFLPDGLRTVLKKGSNLYFWAVLVLSLAGTVLLVSRRDGRSTLLALAIVAMALTPLAFFGDVRFHVPASPLFAIAAAVALTRLVPRLRRRAQSPA